MLVESYPNSLMNLLSAEQKKAFLTLLNKKESEKLDLLKELNGLISSFGGFFSEKKSYRQILERVCEKRKINIDESMSVFEIEELILKEKCGMIYDSLNEEEKEKYNEGVRKEALAQGMSPEQIKSITTVGTLAGANAAGFGLYIMASTIVGGLSGAIGLTLPFAFYTGMSSVLSVVIGPVGWALGLGYVAYSFRNDNIETIGNKVKTTAKGLKNVFTGNLEYCEYIILQICSFRILLQKEIRKEISLYKENIEEINVKLPDFKKAKNELEDKISILKSELSQIKKEIDDAEDLYEKSDNKIRESRFKLNKLINSAEM